MNMSNYDKQNVGKLLRGEGTWFTAHLLRVIAKADEHNLNKLRSAYPDEVAAVETYQQIEWIRRPHRKENDDRM